MIDDELKAQMKLFDEMVDECKLKLQCIEELLGAPYAKDFNEATVSAIVDDVLRYNMMLTDIAKFVQRRIRNELHELVFMRAIERAKEIMKDHKS
ncbi:hypothetical protein D3C85_272640 [compost metagenome]